MYSWCASELVVEFDTDLDVGMMLSKGEETLLEFFLNDGVLVLLLEMGIGKTLCKL